jgi:hypothetical protein
MGNSESGNTVAAMRFIEMTGKTLMRVVSDNEISPEQMRECGVKDDSLVRVNPQGDIELRRPDRWDVIGGLLGEFDARLRHETGLDWA